MNYSKQNFVAGDVLQAKQLNAMDSQVYENEGEISKVKTRLQSGRIEDAELHLGFYLDENGDLCQKEE